jgi:hypothetical protein
MTIQLISMLRVLIVVFLSAALGRASDSKLSNLFAGCSPQPIAVARQQAWKYAEQVAAKHDGAFVVRGDGASMAPLYPSGTVLVIERVPFDQLKRGATVIYRNNDGEPIAHLLVALSRDGWRSAGLGNQHIDDECVSPENFLGVVTSAYTPVDLPLRNSLHYAAQ